jgi:hypothetical protein
MVNSPPGNSAVSKGRRKKEGEGQDWKQVTNRWVPKEAGQAGRLKDLIP